MRTNPSHEDSLPTIDRVAIQPYPDLRRLWVRVGLSPFKKYPNLDVTIIVPEGETALEVSYLETRDTDISFTMHLPQPIPDATYRALFTLSQEDEVLDTKEIAFDLVFQEPAE